MKSKAIWILIIIIILSFWRACSSSQPEPQNPPANIERDIIIALAKKQITGCGEFKWELYPGEKSIYLVNCTKDGKNWTRYTVYGATGEVLPGDFRGK